MENENRKKSKKLFSFRDLILALTVLAAAALLYFLFPRGEGNIAVIEQDGRELYRVVLSELYQPVSFEIPGEYPAVIVAEKDGIFFSSAACPDKDCLRMGKVSRRGEAAVCLPARLVVRIEGEREEGLDGMTG